MTDKAITSQNNKQTVKGSILIVDEDKNVINTIIQLLQHHPYIIFSANNGFQALELMTQHNIDVLISDLKMPVTNGVELLSYVSDIYPETINIALSNDSSKETLIRVVNHSTIFKYIFKPWDNAELITSIETAFAKLACIKQNYKNCPKHLQKYTPTHAKDYNYAPDKQITILVVDDEPAILRAINGIFRNKLYSVFSASSGKAALKLLETNHVDIIISDVRMPKMTGVEFLSIVEEKYPDVIAIILSGYSDISDMFDLIQKPIVYSYLCKPWDNEVLKDKVKKASERLYINRKGLND